MARLPLDLRLALAAPSAWLGSFAVWAIRPSIAVVVATTGVCFGGLALSRFLTCCHSAARLSAAPVAAFAIVSLLAGFLSASLAMDARQIPQELFDRNIPLTLEITSGSKPVASKLAWQTDRVRVHARLRATNDWALNSPVVVFGDLRWAEIPIGSKISTRGKLVPSDTPLNVAPMVTTSRAPRIESDPGPVQATMNRLREGLRLSTTDRDPDGASLVAGLAIGDESGQSPELSEAMLRSGLSHLTAVSGGNTAIVLLLVLGIARVFPTPIWFQASAGGIALLAYLILVGPQPSVLRATVMGAAVLVGLARGGLVPGLPVLSLAAFSLLLMDPSLAVSLGFALSVAATAGLLLLAPSVKRAIAGIPIVGRVPGWFLDALAITVSAQIATAPILLAVGNDISLAAVPANLLVAPVVAPITIAGLLAGLSSPLAPVVASVIAWPATLLGQWIAYVANLTSGWEWAALGHSGGVLILVAALVSSTLVILTRWFRRRAGSSSLPQPPRLLLRGVAIACACCALMIAAWFTIMPPVTTDWKVIACDVGQGSATLIRSDSSVILIDAGPQDGGIDKCLDDAGVARLTAVVITHLHADHSDGLPDVVAKAKVESLFTTSAYLSHEKLREVDEMAGDSLHPEVLAAGQRIDVSGLTGHVLWPHLGAPAAANDMNNGSLVIEFRWDDGYSLLVTGDIETEAQRAIVSENMTRGAIDVVTVPHHGSSSLDPDFALILAPTVALVSVGVDNEYGHPSERSINSFESAGATVFRTDESGSLRLSWPDGQVWVHPL